MALSVFVSRKARCDFFPFEFSQ